jgi:HEAT repeat protein
MCDPDQPPAPDRIHELLLEGDTEKTVACLDRLGAGNADARKRSLRAFRDVADERSGAFEGLAAPLSRFLTDEDRSVRLTAAKLFVTLAQGEPTIIRPIVDTLADRLADDAEFYYVRARCAEALGYVAVEAPDAVTDPETLAELRLGLEFDESEVKEKLAKALVYVALGDSNRLRHQVSSLADHLDDDNELVRYHLCTALVVIGCEHSEKLSAAESALRERLTDENPYVRGRAAEAVALLAKSDVEVESIPVLNNSGAEDGDVPSFLTDRVCFLQERLDDTQSESASDTVGTIMSVREGTDDVVEEMTSPDDGECPHCGLELAASGPPMCPRCGAPR